MKTRTLCSTMFALCLLCAAIVAQPIPRVPTLNNSYSRAFGNCWLGADVTANGNVSGDLLNIHAEARSTGHLRILGATFEAAHIHATAHATPWQINRTILLRIRGITRSLPSMAYAGYLMGNMHENITQTVNVLPYTYLLSFVGIELNATVQVGANLTFAWGLQGAPASSSFTGQLGNASIMLGGLAIGSAQGTYTVGVGLPFFSLVYMSNITNLPNQDLQVWLDANSAGARGSLPYHLDPVRLRLQLALGMPFVEDPTATLVDCTFGGHTDGDLLH